jgi:hypothetical protein
LQPNPKARFHTESLDALPDDLTDGISYYKEIPLDSHGRLGVNRSYYWKIPPSEDYRNWPVWMRQFFYRYDTLDFREPFYPIQNSPDLIAKKSEITHKYGFVNAEGFWVIQPYWDFVTGFDPQDPFFKGQSSFVWNYGHKFSRWGLIDRQGHYLLKPHCIGLRRLSKTMFSCTLPFDYKGDIL